MSLLRGRRYDRQKMAKNDGGIGTPKLSVGQIDLRLTADKLAAEHGVSVPTVKRAGQFAEAVETLGIERSDRHPKSSVTHFTYTSAIRRFQTDYASAIERWPSMNACINYF